MTVGSTVANIWATQFTLGAADDASGPSFFLVPSTIEAQTPHANIWIDNTLIAGPHASPSFGVGQLAATILSIGSDFENAYSSDTTHFASSDYPSTARGVQTSTPACDGSGKQTGTTVSLYTPEPIDLRTNVVVLNSAGNLGEGAGGYFAAINFASQASLNCELPAHVLESNEAPMIYLGWFEANGANYELGEDLVRGTAHEFQHLINYVHHGIIGPTAGTEQFVDEDDFINEGLSVLAQDLAVHDLHPNVEFDSLDALALANSYLTFADDVSVSGFKGITPTTAGGDGVTPKPGCYGCYGGAYLFERYLRDRFGGDTYTHGIETNAQVGFANLSATCGCGETAQQLLQDFFIAAAASSADVTSKNPAYNFGTLSLLGTYASPLAGLKGQTLRGVNALSVPSGGSISSTVPLGGAAFYDVTALRGETLTIDDRNVGADFQLTGALIAR